MTDYSPLVDDILRTAKSLSKHMEKILVLAEASAKTGDIGFITELALLCGYLSLTSEAAQIEKYGKIMSEKVFADFDAEIEKIRG